MTDDTRMRKATGGRELAELFIDIHEGDRLRLTYETPDGEERTAHVEAATRAQATELARDEPAEGNVAFWYRDLDRDAVPFATVRYRQHGQGPPVVRIHGHTPSTESTDGVEYLGDVKRAAVDEGGEGA